MGFSLAVSCCRAFFTTLLWTEAVYGTLFCRLFSLFWFAYVGVGVGAASQGEPRPRACSSQAVVTKHQACSISKLACCVVK